MDFAEFCALGAPEEIGISGTRQGSSQQQRDALAFAIENLHEHGALRLHHGKCQGIDAFAHGRAYRLRSSGMVVTVHPPVKAQFMACDLPMWRGCIELGPAAYHLRDLEIVRDSGVLLAAPLRAEDDPRSKHSGTWLTVRFARSEKVPVYLCDSMGNIYPD